MATYTYTFSDLSDSNSTSSTNYTGYRYPKRPIQLKNTIPPFSTINSATLTYSTTTSSSGKSSSYSMGTGYWPKNSTTFSVFSSSGTGTGITNDITSYVGSGTFQAGQALEAIGFRWRMKRSSLLSGSASRTVKMTNISITYDYTPPSTILKFYFLHNNISEDAVFKTASGTSQTGIFTTYVDGVLGADGHSATITISDLDTYYSGFHPSYWTDGNNNYNITNGSATITWQDSDTEKSFSLVFEPNTYTVNFWDNTQNPATLVSTMTCQGGITYTTPALPSHTSPPGYTTNTTGWIKDLVSPTLSSYNKICKYSISSDNLAYYSDITSVYNSSYVTQYTSFSDLTTINGGIIDLYFIEIPIAYRINYKVRLSTSSSYNGSSLYRVYGEGNYTLSNLQNIKSLTTGYKWLNTTPNSWYTTEKTNSTGYSSEGEQITSISPTYIGDVNLFAYQIPIDYTVVRHVYDINGNEIDFNGAEILNCKYGTSYNINTNLTLNTTSTTVTCPAIVEESYENRTNDAKYGFNLITDNNINTYTKETFTDTGVAMMKLIIKAKAPCVLALNISAKCYSTSNRFFISKLDGEPLSNLYTITDSNDLLSYYYNSSSYYSCSPVLKYYISSGTHWLYIKYRRNTTSTSSNYINYNSLSFTTSYEAIRVDKVFLGWYSNPITLSSNFGFPIQKTLVSTPTSYLATVLNFQDQLFQSLNLPAITQENDTSFSNLTTVDGTILHYYAYYIPGEQYINYLWLDNYGKKEIYQIPCDSYLYNKTTGKVSIIPNYNKYNEDNVGTINWYYYENNDTTSLQLINNSNTVSSAILGDTYFYGYKEPITTRTISSQIIDPAFGTVIIKNAKQTYNENDEIFITINPTNYSILMNAYYIEEDYPNIQHLLVGANDKIILEDSNIIIYPQFRSKQAYAPSNYLNVYEGGND